MMNSSRKMYGMSQQENQPLSASMRSSSNLSLNSVSSTFSTSTQLTQASTQANQQKKRLKQAPPVDVIQILRQNYGITLSAECEERVLQAQPLTVETVQNELLDEMTDGAYFEPHRGELTSALSPTADVVEQMHHVTKFRNELVLPAGLEPNRPAQWTEAQLERGSELMQKIHTESTRVRETVRQLKTLAGALGIADPAMFDV